MMTKQLLLLLALAALVGCRPQQSIQNQYAVIPLPQSLTPQEGQFALNNSPSLSLLQDDADAQKVLSTFAGFLQTNGVPLSLSTTPNRAGLTFELTEEIAHPEGYQLAIDPQQVRVRARTPQGLFYATQTLKQLLQKDPQLGWYLPAVQITDAPRFTYRGMHLDVARHFHPVETVKAMLDQMAYHKLNTFHWHLTEDQGWRIEIKQFPKLTEVGAYRNGTLVGHYNDQPQRFDGKRYGGYFTQEEIREVVQYAADRFITVIPEIELPGHAQAALAAYPELGCEAGPYEVWQQWGISENVYCPTETTFRFLEGVFDEVVELFPSKYIHIGGDECPKTQWKKSAFCQDLMRREGLKDEYELQSYFVRRIEKHLNSKGKQIIGWDEILEGGVAPNATIMSWRGIEGGIEAAKAGHDVIMTPTDNCYLDYYQSDHPDEPLAIGGYLPLQKVYAFEPVPEALNTEESKHILGTQVNVWTEYIPTREKLEYMVFPRLCASAEVGWSAQDRDFHDFVQRLVPHLDRLQAMGIRPANHLYDIKSNCSAGDGAIQVALEKLADDAQIHYTLDGSAPSPESPVYETPIPIVQSTTVRAQCFRQAQPIGRPWQQRILWHLATGKIGTLETPPHPKYGSSGAQALINGIQGSDERYGDAEWLGFDGKDGILTIDLEEEQVVSKLHFRFFKGEGQWIYLPRKVTVALSVDGKIYRNVGQTDQVQGSGKVVSPSIEFTPTPARFIRIEIENFGEIPEGAQGAGNKAWLFVDEVRVE